MIIKLVFVMILLGNLLHAQCNICNASREKLQLRKNNVC